MSTLSGDSAGFFTSTGLLWPSRIPGALPSLSARPGIYDWEQVCPRSRLGLPLQSASNAKQEHVFCGLSPRLPILLHWRTFQNTGKALDLWLTHGPTSCHSPHELCSLETGGFDVVLLESCLLCNFSLINTLLVSELWARGAIFSYFDMIE